VKSKLAISIVTTIVIISMVIGGCAPAADSGSPSSGATGETITWVVQSKNPTIQPAVQVMVEGLQERVKTATGGKFVIKVHEPGAIVAKDEEWAGVQSGTLDAAFTTMVNNKSVFGPISGLFNEYAGSPNPDAWAAWYHHGDGLTYMQELADKHGYDNVFCMGPVSLAGAEDEMWSNKKINSVEDYDGLKIRTFGDWGKILADLGASVIYLPAGEVYQALERGIIDATELSGRATNLKFGLHEVTDYCYYPGVHAPAATADLYVNRESFDALPLEYQQILEMEVRYSAMTTLLMMPVLNGEATTELIEYGVEFIELPIEIQAYIIQAADDMWNGYGAEDPFFQEVYDNQKAFVKAYTSVANVVQPNVSMLLDYDL
jgi:TRAP-type mannitol/chloroaromatic compound transport system substrate-binding protein